MLIGLLTANSDGLEFSVMTLIDSEAGLTLLTGGEGGELAVKECPMCRALVAEQSIHGHEEFHRRLRAS